MVTRSLAGLPAVNRDGAQPGPITMQFSIDGSLPLSLAPVGQLGALCDRAEDHPAPCALVVYLSGAPADLWSDDLTVALVSRWERALRRLERIAAPTIAVASGDCGGLALDALLAADYRIAAPSLRLLVPRVAQAAWPGMAMYRLCQQAGPAAVRQPLLRGIPVDATTAKALHLVDEVTDDVQAALAAAVRAAAESPGAELAIRRQLMLDASFVTFEDALGSHLAACDRAIRQAVEP